MGERKKGGEGCSDRKMCGNIRDLNGLGVIRFFHCSRVNSDISN